MDKTNELVCWVVDHHIIYQLFGIFVHINEPYSIFILRCAYHTRIRNDNEKIMLLDTRIRDGISNVFKIATMVEEKSQKKWKFRRWKRENAFFGNENGSTLLWNRNFAMFTPTTGKPRIQTFIKTYSITIPTILI